MNDSDRERFIEMIADQLIRGSKVIAIESLESFFPAEIECAFELAEQEI